MDEVINYQIYDRIFKKILTLSGRAVINLINGLFGTHYPTDASVDYNWTEFHDDKLKRTLADTIITINKSHCYHIEAQTYEDGSIVFRVFEYGYRHAERHKFNKQGGGRIIFPEPKILYIYTDGRTPDKYKLTLDFGTQGSFVYQVPCVQLKDISIRELNEKKMVILIPFYLMSLRKQIAKKRTPENLEQLKKLIFDDIIGSIETNLELGNITHEDADRLNQMTLLLYKYLYANYSELKEISDMTDESLLLPYDIFIRKYNIDNLYETLDRVQHLDEDEERVRADEQKVRADEQKVRADEQKLKTDKQKLKADEQKLRADEQKVRADEQKLKADEQKLKADEQKLKADEQKVRADEQKVRADEQKLKADEQKLKADKQKLKDGEQKLKADEQKLKADEQKLKADEQKLKADEQKFIHRVVNGMKRMNLDHEETCTALAEILDVSVDEARKFL